MEFEYIKTGYCQSTDCFKTALKSMITWPLHNQVLNGWTMIFGVAIITSLSPRKPLHMLQLAALWIHLPMSFMYHTMTCSKKHCMFFRSLDIFGILVAGVLLAFIMSSVAFPTQQWIIYILVVTNIIFTAIHARTSLLPVLNHQTKFTISKESRYNTLSLISLSVFVYHVPIIAMLILRSDLRMYCIIALLTLSIAAVLYITGYPECKCPTTFDIVGNSHNIIHVLLIIHQIAIWLIIQKS